MIADRSRRFSVDSIMIFLLLIPNSASASIPSSAAPAVTSMSASSTALAAAGGAIVLIVNVQAATWVMAARAMIARPDGGQDPLPLAMTAGSSTSGTFQGGMLISSMLGQRETNPATR